MHQRSCILRLEEAVGDYKEGQCPHFVFVGELTCPTRVARHRFLEELRVQVRPFASLILGGLDEALVDLAAAPKMIADLMVVREAGDTAGGRTRVRAAPAQNQPHVGYVYPAGGRQGANFEVTVGGQFLDGVSQAHVSGGGVSVTVLSHEKPLTQVELNRLRQKAREAQERMQAERKKPFAERKSFAEIAKEFGLSMADLQKLGDLKALQADKKRQHKVTQEAVTRGFWKHALCLT